MVCWTSSSAELAVRLCTLHSWHRNASVAWCGGDRQTRSSGGGGLQAAA